MEGEKKTTKRERRGEGRRVKKRKEGECAREQDVSTNT